LAHKAQMTGMLGVYLVAAELTRRYFIVSPTSRSAAGADLLVTDQACQKAWSVQVKTNRDPTSYWLFGANTARLKSGTHMYVFVNVGYKERAEFIVVPSSHVAAKVFHEISKTGSEWYSFSRSDRVTVGEGWELFGDPHGNATLEIQVDGVSEGEQS
jgi:hypothetical protein